MRTCAWEDFAICHNQHFIIGGRSHSDGEPQDREMGIAKKGVHDY